MAAETLLARVKAATNWDDELIGLMLGVAKNTVQAYRTGRRTEYLNPIQRAHLLSELRRTQHEIHTLADEIELTS